MRQILTVFKFTFKEAVRKKAFIISSLIILLLILVGSLVPRGIDFFVGGEKSKEDRTGATYYYADEENVIPAGEQAIKAAFPHGKIVRIESEEIEKYKKEIRDENTENSIVVIEQEKEEPKIKIVSYNFMSGIDGKAVADVLNKTYMEQNLVRGGVSPALIDKVMNDIPVEREAVGDMTVTSYVLSIMLTFLIFFSIYYYGYAVATSVATEKASRVMETLVVSAKPSRILIGKILAMGVLGLLQLLVLLAFGALCYRLFIPGGFTIGGVTMDVSGFTAKTVVLLLIFFVLGYGLYAVMNSVSGALVSKLEDLNAAMMPVLLIALVSFYMGYIGVVMGGKGILVTVSTYIPFSSPFVIPARLLSGDLTGGEIFLSMVILVVATAVITRISIGIYSSSVLRYGNRQKLLKVLREKK